MAHVLPLVQLLIQPRLYMDTSTAMLPVRSDSGTIPTPHVSHPATPHISPLTTTQRLPTVYSLAIQPTFTTLTPPVSQLATLLTRQPLCTDLSTAVLPVQSDNGIIRTQHVKTSA